MTGILLDAKDLIPPMSFKKKCCLGKTILLKSSYRTVSYQIVAQMFFIYKHGP